MSYILFHVPHSSLKIPKLYWSICIKDRDYIAKSNNELCDYLTNKLLPSNCHKIIFNYSRIFCDVEKFKDNLKEIMVNKGMGVLYTKNCDGIIIAIPTKKYQKK